MATTKTSTKTTTTKAAAKKATPTKATSAKQATTPKAKSFDFMGYPGLAMSATNRETGSIVNIWFTAQGGPDKGNAKPWSVECETHGTHRATDTRTEAREFRMSPATFCTKCATAAKERAAEAKKGGAVKDAPAKKAASTKAPAKVASKKATGAKKAAA